ncbi:hypothetical protein LB941_04180 [Ligilactobacillus sp. WILCCON 0076]|uniref:Uncharacterized protein n=1 Tax=Ligilactobacillus ubinensis TaxID=2876789 RepID=A0A9X2FIE4_9LACO|nr:hypothetical protein [Ligilactobacillus ubinensis]MCP0886534.1 hypothetical protein [Ligilactobacillus ubinensis]
MNETIIKKLESRMEKNKAWRLESTQTGHFLDVVFSTNLEDTIRNKRNFSFNRFESEQLNELSRLMPQLENDYRLELTSSNIGLGYLPLKADVAQPLLQEV